MTAIPKTNSAGGESPKCLLNFENRLRRAVNGDGHCGEIGVNCVCPESDEDAADDEDTDEDTVLGIVSGVRNLHEVGCADRGTAGSVLRGKGVVLVPALILMLGREGTDVAGRSVLAVALD